MTRINLVPPSELMDQHLFAEFREIKMVPKALQRSLEAAKKRTNATNAAATVLNSIPKAFTLNTGHVCFFYNKGAYLTERYESLKNELTRRGFNFNVDSVFDPDAVFKNAAFNNNYVPTPEAFSVVRQRIAEKIAMKPSWYRYYGNSYSGDVLYVTV